MISCVPSLRTWVALPWTKGEVIVKVTVEYNKCGTEITIDTCNAIRAIIEAAENKSIFSGFICTECGEDDDED
jgi:glutamine synthetase